MRVASALILAAFAVVIAGCGGNDKTSSATVSDTSATASTLPPALAAKLRYAEHPRLSDFPASGGQSLQALAATAKSGPQVGLAASVLLPGVNRLAFGVIGADRTFVYGRSALYFARSPNAPAQGPFLAPADSFVPAKPYLSRTAAADTADIKAIYATQVNFKQPGSYSILVMSRSGGRLLSATTQVKVRRTNPIPDVGDRPPLISTPTVASAGGNLDKIDTRAPHDDMHKVNFRDVIAKRPVALLFSTPLLCQSRVCGPVTDLELELEHTYGDRMTFIHQEVYAANDVSKGLRPQLTAFHLETEPWLFTFDRSGRVAARLEGAFGINAFRAAVEAALR